MLASMASGGRSLAKQRHERIVTEVRLRGSARVAELAELLLVSEMTVRRDLDALDEAGLVVKVHGGATAPSEHTSDEPTFAAKSLLNVDEKRAIARAAARFVEAGNAIGISAGTTTWHLALELVPVPRLTVVTNSVPVAEVFTSRPRSDRTTILTGGVCSPSSALVGPIAISTLATIHLDTVFMGVHGVTERAGFSTPNLLEADTNRAFVEAAARTVVLADHTKFGVTGLSTFAALGDADVLISDDQLRPSDRDVLDQAIEHVMMAPTNDDHDRPLRRA
jgi:DeoR/GlpR family transcriptional regulator of sugar metabolism